MALRIHRFLPSTRVEGPGIRACVQVQGCPIRCRGCAVPFTWPEKGGYEVSVESLADQIIEGLKVEATSVEGITFLGGEPFAQAGELARLGRILKQEGLSVVTFTGHLLEDLQASGDQHILDLIHVTDLLIDGPFVKELLDTSRPWVGSSNQRYHFLTERYRHLEGRLNEIPNRLEVRLAPDGRVMVNGLADVNTLEGLFSSLLE